MPWQAETALLPETERFLRLAQIDADRPPLLLGQEARRHVPIPYRAQPVAIKAWYHILIPAQQANMKKESRSLLCKNGQQNLPLLLVGLPTRKTRQK